MSTDPLFSIFYDWEISTLGDIVARGGGSIQTGPFGSQLHASDYVDHGIPSIMPQNIANDRISEEGIARITEEDAKRLSKYRVRKGDIIYSRRGDVERRALVKQEHDGWLCGTGCLKVSFGHGLVVPEYAAFYLSHPASRSWVVQHAVGATMPNLNTSILSALPFVLPPISEQKRIADALNSLDDKIELNRRMNETLEEMARALFRDWFIDFGPTRRQMDGATDPAAIMGHAFPNDKTAALAPLFPARLGENGLPEGWEPGTASDHIDFNPREPMRKGTLAPYTDMASLPTSGSLITPPTERDFKAGMRFRNGDVLIARITPCLENGKAGFVDFLTEESPVGWGSTEFFVLRAKPHVAPQFSYCLVRDSDFKKRAEQSMTGTSGRQRAQVKVLMSHEIPTPTDEVHTAFGEFTALLFAKIKANGQENQTLTALRDLLLPKLMSGEIQLKDAPMVQDTLDGQPIESSQRATLKNKPDKMRIPKMNSSGSVKN